MELFCIISAMAILGMVAFQDFRERKISWILLPLLLGVLLISGVQSPGMKDLWIYFGVNLSFIVLQVGVLFLYFSLKNRKLTNIVNQYIGIGDLLFFVVICAAFSPVNFILFYCACLVISLLFVAVWKAAIRREMREIPLAGIFSVVMIVIVVCNYVFQIDFYNDELVLHAISGLEQTGSGPTGQFTGTELFANCRFAHCQLMY